MSLCPRCFGSRTIINPALRDDGLNPVDQPLTVPCPECGGQRDVHCCEGHNPNETEEPR